MKIALRSPRECVGLSIKEPCACRGSQAGQSRNQFIRATEHALFQKVMVVLALQIDATDHNC